MTLLDDLTATHWHVSRAARDGVPPHRRLEIAFMSKSTHADVAAVVARLTEIGAHDEAATVTALATDLDASRLLGPHRDWWADIAASVGRSCVTLPDVAVAVREVVERKDAEIARLRAGASTVGALLATHLDAIRSRDVVIECFDGELFAQISYEESVIDDLRGGEHHQTVHNYYAERTFDAGQWSDTEPLFDVDMIADRLNHPARIVAVGQGQSDADPNTRGPIGGAL